MRTLLVVLAAGTLCSPGSSLDPPVASASAARDPVTDAVLGTQPSRVCTSEDDVAAIDTGAFAEQIVAAGDHTCARLRGGTVRCWGDNERGELGGCETQTATGLPRSFLGPIAAIDVAVGPRATCAAAADGSVTCTARLRETLGGRGPGPIAGVTAVAGVAVGEQHACALRTDATLVCFGDWTVADVMGPDVLVEDDGSDAGRAAGVVSVAGTTRVISGANHTCALDGQGQVTCWGRNGQGQLGDPRAGEDIEDNRGSLRRVPGVPRVEDFAAAGDTTCALVDGGQVYCWGQGFGPKALPLATPPAVDVAVGPGFVCVATRSGSVTCQGQPPSDLAAGFEGALEIAVGRAHLCARRKDGTVRCQGDNAKGQLGTGKPGAPTSRPQPALLDGVPL